MSQPKGKVPIHIKSKEFQHPGIDNHIILILNEIEEPRKPSCNFRHSLVTIIFVSLIGVLCGAKDWEEIVQAAEGMIDWIGKYVDVSSGIPSNATLKRVMSLIPTKSLENWLFDELSTATLNDISLLLPNIPPKTNRKMSGKTKMKNRATLSRKARKMSIRAKV